MYQLSGEWKGQDKKKPPKEIPDMETVRPK